MQKTQLKPFILGLSISVVALAIFFTGALADRIFVIKPLNYLIDRSIINEIQGTESVRKESSFLGNLLNDESVFSVADIAENASQSVVTVSIKKQQQVIDPNSFFSPFGLFGMGGETRIEEVQRDIGTGFVVEKNGLIVTNKHVVSDLQAEYKIIDKDDKEYNIAQIYRDPSIDLAILQVEDFNLEPLPLGNSEELRVGESVIAIGTALGEFRHTVTTGVISGLGRGIEATDGVASIESLEGVIQTDAAINPGNSGGPLISERGQVIGVNVATANADNISFAIPINVIKASLTNFESTGRFERPLLGVSYRMISQQAALFNEVPQGAYLLEVKQDSSAGSAGLQPNDIIVEFDGQSLKNNDLAALINQKKIGDRVKIKYWRDQEDREVEVELRGL
jgi:serine protease Do